MDENDTKKRKGLSDSESSDSESSDSEPDERKPFKSYTSKIKSGVKQMTNAAAKAASALKTAHERLQEDPDDPHVQGKYDRKYAELYPDLKKYNAKLSDGQTELDDKKNIYNSLKQIVDTKGNTSRDTLYKHMMENDDAESPKFEVVPNFLSLNFFKLMS